MNLEVSEVELKYVKKVKFRDLPKITCSRELHQIFRNYFDEDTIDHSESVHVLYLNRSNRVLATKRISYGGSNSSVVEPKIIMQTAILMNASAFAVAHNHPSGETKPSEQDIKITERLKQCGNILDIKLIDHLILGEDNNYFSFADEGQI